MSTDDVAGDEAAIQLDRHTGWLQWAERHPGVVLLGALAMAILALRRSPPTDTSESAARDEEVPLFI